MFYSTHLSSLVDRYILLIKDEQEIAKFRSALIRYFIPCLGGPEPQGLRAKHHEIEAGMSYLDKLKIEEAYDGINQLELFFDTKGLEKAKRRVPRSLIKKFLDQFIVWGYYKNSTDSVEKNFPEATIDNPCSPNKSNKKPINHGQKTQAPFALMAKRNTGKLIYPDDYINNQLEEDLNNFSNFRGQQGVSPNTIGMAMDEIYRILGWLHRYKNIALEDLRLNKIITYSQLIVKMDAFLKEGLKEGLKTDKALNKDTYNEYIFKKAMARELACIEADETVQLIKEYLDFYGNHPSTSALAVKIFIHVAHFIYRYEVGTDEYPEKSDIPVCKKLMNLQKMLCQQEAKTPHSVPHDKKKIPWETALEVLERVRSWHGTKTINYDEETKHISCRADQIQANNLQRFLMLAFFLLMPPDRSRTYYEMEIDRTLVHGFYDGINFVAFNKMKNPKEARWYIHLEPNDYKTGKFYGDWWGEVPNTKFPDGKTFYWYIELWLTWGREVGQKVEHNRFFRGMNTYAPLKAGDIGHIIRRILEGCTGVPVTPKEIRKMYVSYLKAKGATEAELEAAACAMHHSRRMQSQIYDQQEQFKKIRPAFEFNARVAQDFFSKLKSNAA